MDTNYSATSNVMSPSDLTAIILSEGITIFNHANVINVLSCLLVEEDIHNIYNETVLLLLISLEEYCKDFPIINHLQKQLKYKIINHFVFNDNSCLEKCKTQDIYEEQFQFSTNTQENIKPEAADVSELFSGFLDTQEKEQKHEKNN